MIPEPTELSPQALASIQPRLQRAVALHQAGQLAEAEPLYRDILAQHPGYLPALQMLGVLSFMAGRQDEGLALLQRVVEAAPMQAEAHNNLGNALRESGQAEAAVQCFERAIALQPGFVGAHYNLGNALAVLQRHEAAVAAYDRCLALQPAHYNAWAYKASALSALYRFDAALAAYDQCVALQPGLAQNHSHRATALIALGRFEAAVAACEDALLRDPGLIDALQNQFIALFELGRFQQAMAVGDRLMALAPEIDYQRGNILFAAVQACHWDRYAERVQEIDALVAQGRRADVPFSYLAISHSPALQLACNRAFVQERHPASPQPLWQGERYRHDRIRVAYLSADFREHATAYLMAELFEKHSRQRFEFSAYSYGAQQPGPMRNRLVKAFDRFIDVSRFDDAHVAALLREHEIDILVDLKGYTAEGRTGILALRPAPIQVNYLGFPGTMGADYIDYIIGDATVTPPEHDVFYAEKVVRLPGSYQVNDRQRVIAPHSPTRAACGLPDEGFVFCSFNNNFKITPAIFDIWMRLLVQIPGSVLWLLKANTDAHANLQREAVNRGVDPGRLVFAARVPLAEHLARHRLADLFLDTLPYNAHTTTSDALWAGLPVLTCLGETFAGRVAASLLRAADLPDLVTTSLKDYEALALRLAREPRALAALRERLHRQRDSCLLFDTDRFCSHLESAYQTMHQNQQSGHMPRSFSLEVGA